MGLFLSALLLLGCSSSGATVELALKTPAAPDPFAGVRTLKVTVSGIGMDPVSASAILGQDPAVQVPPVPLGIGREVQVDGLDGAGAVVSVGRSASFDLTAEGPSKVEVPFHRLERFSLMGAALPTGRYDHGAVLVEDGRVAVVGGRDGGDAVTATVELYDPTTDTFSSAPALTTARARPLLGLASGKVVVVGGETNNGEPVDTVELYDPATGTTDTFRLRTPRTRAAMTAVSAGSFFLAGGINAAGEIASRTEIIDTSTTSSSEGPEGGPAAVDLAVVTLASGTILAAGGRLSDGSISSRVYQYVIGSEEWSSFPSLAAGRASAASVLLGDEAWLLGGEGPSPEHAVALGASELGPALSVAHAAHAAAAVDASMAVVAGGAGQAASVVEIVEASGVRAAGELNVPRQQHTLTTLTDGSVVVIGGLDAGGVVTDQVERFYAN